MGKSENLRTRYTSKCVHMIKLKFRYNVIASWRSKYKYRLQQQTWRIFKTVTVVSDLPTLSKREQTYNNEFHDSYSRSGEK